MPRFLLSRFANDGKIYVFDRESGGTREVSVKDVALRKNFYRVDVPGMAPDAFENALGEIESAASRVLRQVEKSHELPTDAEDQRTLLYFIALQAARVPKQRANLDGSLQEAFRIMSVQVVSHRYDEIRDMVAETDPEAARLSKDELIRMMADPDSIGIKVAPELELMLVKEMADAI